MNQVLVSETRKVTHPIYGDTVEVPVFYGRPNDVPQSDVDAAVEVFATWANSEMHLDWMTHGYRALRAGVLRNTGATNPDAIHSHDEAVEAFRGTCLHGYVPTGVRNRIENPVLGTYRTTSEHVCKYCGDVEHKLIEYNNYSGD